MDKDKNIIRNVNNIIMDGILYCIPERYTINMAIGVEYKSLFNYILACVMHSRNKIDNLSIESVNKNHLDKYIVMTERIFAFIITGKMDNVVFSKWEQDIIKKIPLFIIPKITSSIVEEFD